MVIINKIVIATHLLFFASDILCVKNPKKKTANTYTVPAKHKIDKKSSQEKEYAWWGVKFKDNSFAQEKLFKFFVKNIGKPLTKDKILEELASIKSIDEKFCSFIKNLNKRVFGTGFEIKSSNNKKNKKKNIRYTLQKNLNKPILETKFTITKKIHDSNIEARYALEQNLNCSEKDQPADENIQQQFKKISFIECEKGNAMKLLYDFLVLPDGQCKKYIMESALEKAFLTKSNLSNDKKTIKNFKIQLKNFQRKLKRYHLTLKKEKKGNSFMEIKLLETKNNDENKLIPQEPTSLNAQQLSTENKKAFDEEINCIEPKKLKRRNSTEGEEEGHITYFEGIKFQSKCDIQKKLFDFLHQNIDQPFTKKNLSEKLNFEQNAEIRFDKLIKPLNKRFKGTGYEIRKTEYINKTTYILRKNIKDLELLNKPADQRIKDAFQKITFNIDKQDNDLRIFYNCFFLPDKKIRRFILEATLFNAFSEKKSLENDKNNEMYKIKKFREAFNRFQKKLKQFGLVIKKSSNSSIVELETKNLKTKNNDDLIIEEAAHNNTITTIKQRKEKKNSINNLLLPIILNYSEKIEEEEEEIFFSSDNNTKE